MTGSRFGEPRGRAGPAAVAPAAPGTAGGDDLLDPGAVPATAGEPGSVRSAAPATAGEPPLGRARWAKSGVWVAIGLVLVAFPLVFSTPSITSIAVFTVIFMASATAWNGFCGYSGYISIGHAVFFGCGAYTLALISSDFGFSGGYGVFWLVPLAGLVAAAVAVPFGLVSLRTRRHTFVVITIAFLFIFQLLAYNLPFTKGSAGVAMPAPPWLAVGYNQRFYFAALGCLVVALLLSVGVRRSRFGLQLLAIRDDEDRAVGLGVRATRVKLIALVISAVAVGMAGAVWAFFLGQIYPAFAFTPLFDLSVAIMAFLGGLGTISGPLFGAALLESLQQYFIVRFSADNIYLIAYGALFLLVILLLPRGVIPTVSDGLRNRFERRADERSERAGAAGAVSRPPPARAIPTVVRTGVEEP